MDISTEKTFFPIAWFRFLSQIIIGIIIRDTPRISGNKVNARKRHFITRSRVNSITRLPCRYAHKNN